MINWQAGIPDVSWDKTLYAHNGHFLQSTHNIALQQAMGHQVFYAQGQDWQCFARLERSALRTHLYCPYGPVVKSQKGLREALKALQDLAKTHDAQFVRLEPTGAISEKILKNTSLISVRDLQPKYTWVKDLTQTKEALLAEMTATNRNLYRSAESKGLTFRTSTDPNDMQQLINMIHDVAKHTGMRPLSDERFRTMAHVLMERGVGRLYLAEYEGRPLSTAFTFESPHTWYYAHGGAFRSERKLHPSSPLLVKIFLDAKKAGAGQFDFYGTAPPDHSSEHYLAGITRFKQSFGGEYKAYNGTWEMPTKPLHYHAFKTVGRLKRALRR